MYKLYIDSITSMIAEISEKQIELKKAKDDDDVTKLHYLTRQLQAWFRAMGGLPIGS
jgi:hypothetical protein